MILVIDNYDSFTYNLVQYIGQFGGDSMVRRNDEISLDEIVSLSPLGVLLSPGPCRPTDSGVCLDVTVAATSGPLVGTPLFGVCLGHQALGLLPGGSVGRSSRVMHGKSSQIEHDGQGLFAGLENPMTVARYHSLSIESGRVPSGFSVTSRSLDDGEIMGIRHHCLPVEGVQFHPESILTVGGETIVANFVNQCLRG